MISYKPFWTGFGFGDRLMAGWMVRILIDNGFNAHGGRNKYSDLIDCPEFPDSDCEIRKIKLNNTIRDGPGCETNLIDQKLDRIAEVVGKKLVVGDHFIPVKYEDIPQVKGVDVAICSTTGNYSIYRNWPYFDELKSMLDNNGITYLDMDNPGPGMHPWRSHWVLNCVNKSKLYLGLETGTSHYVSKYAAGKALILQSGYTDFEYWAKYYDYDKISMHVDCSPCFLNKFKPPCPHEHKCMSDLCPEAVFEVIQQKLID